MKKKKHLSRKEAVELYNSYVPEVTERISDTLRDDDGNLILIIENTGLMNRIMQKIAKKPETSKIHLDEKGTFVFERCDGKRNIESIAADFRGSYKEDDETLYNHLIKYFEILESYDFIRFMKPMEDKGKDDQNE